MVELVPSALGAEDPSYSQSHGYRLRLAVAVGVAVDAEVRRAGSPSTTTGLGYVPGDFRGEAGVVVPESRAQTAAVALRPTVVGATKPGTSSVV
ncbi:hypothetical protein [Streptomyces sp. cmx-4-7]|uniref:hypothetical protein n=1 Tax=Streptomyces sp. cmx-4-7 TaxID=2790939 RepID=UPI00397FDCC2